MKAQAPRVHLLDCELPLLSYSSVAVRCGEILANASPKWMFEAGESAPHFSPLTTCIKCFDSFLGETVGTARYVYGLVNAQAEIDSAEASD